MEGGLRATPRVLGVKAGTQALWLSWKTLHPATGCSRQKGCQEGPEKIPRALKCSSMLSLSDLPRGPGTSNTSLHLTRFQSPSGPALCPSRDMVENS